MDPRSLGDLLRPEVLRQYLESPAPEPVYEQQPNLSPYEPPIDFPTAAPSEWVELRGTIDVSCWFRREYLVGTPREQVLQWIHLRMGDPTVEGPWLPQITYNIRQLEKAGGDAPAQAAHTHVQPDPGTDWERERQRVQQQIEEEQFLANREVAFHHHLGQFDPRGAGGPGPGVDQRLGSERAGEDAPAGQGPGRPGDGDDGSGGGGLERIAALLQSIRDDLLDTRTRSDEPAGGGLPGVRDGDHQPDADDPQHRGGLDPDHEDGAGSNGEHGADVPDRPDAVPLRGGETGVDQPEHERHPGATGAARTGQRASDAKRRPAKKEYA